MSGGLSTNSFGFRSFVTNATETAIYLGEFEAVSSAPTNLQLEIYYHANGFRVEQIISI